MFTNKINQQHILTSKANQPAQLAYGSLAGDGIGVGVGVGGSVGASVGVVVASSGSASLPPLPAPVAGHLFAPQPQLEQFWQKACAASPLPLSLRVQTPQPQPQPKQQEPKHQQQHAKPKPLPAPKVQPQPQLFLQPPKIQPIAQPLRRPPPPPPPPPQRAAQHILKPPPSAQNKLQPNSGPTLQEINTSSAQALEPAAEIDEIINTQASLPMESPANISSANTTEMFNVATTAFTTNTFTHDNYRHRGNESDYHTRAPLLLEVAQQGERNSENDRGEEEDDDISWQLTPPSTEKATELASRNSKLHKSPTTLRKELTKVSQLLGNTPASVIDRPKPIKVGKQNFITQPFHPIPSHIPSHLISHPISYPIPSHPFPSIPSNPDSLYHINNCSGFYS